MSEAHRSEFLQDLIAGLRKTPKTVPGKYLWDEDGSKLFDQICNHPDYYPTQCEFALLSKIVPDLSARLGPGVTIVEFGSGASRKIRTLLDALDRPSRYVAVDISRDYLESSVRQLASDYPGIEMIAVCADYSRSFELPLALDGPVLGFFPGTSIGNIAPDEAKRFLARARDLLGANHFLIGVDPTQDEAKLKQAYGDCGGLMPAFHLNLLARIEREFGADLDRDAFRHEARVRSDPFRIEAHLVARRPTTIGLDGVSISFGANESLRTDLSHKYAPDAFHALAAESGWSSERTWLDPSGNFSLHLLAG